MIVREHIRQEATREFNVIRNERGVVLVIGLLLLAVLTIMALAGNNNTLIDTAIAFNNLSAVRSLYLAEAGLERGKLECVQRYLDGNWTSFNTILKGSDNTLGTPDDGIPTFGNSVSFHGGTYMVRVTNDPSDGINDTNSIVRIMSTGSFGGSTTKLQIYLSMTLNPNVPAALTMAGEAEVFVADGVSFSIDGRDYRLADADGFPSGTTAKLGVGVGDVDNVSWMNNTPNAVGLVSSSGLSNNSERQAVQGAGYNFVTNTPSVGQQNTVTRMSLRAMADSFKAIADNMISYPPGFSGSSDASGNLLNWPSSGQTTCLGSTANPKITYIDVTDNSITNAGISLSGTGVGGISGAGILVVDGSNLDFSGKVNWTGLVIVVGDFGSFSTGAAGGTSGTDLVRIRGGLMIGEYLTDQGSDEVSINTVTNLQYSTEAINMISNLLLSKPPYSVRAWQRVY
jgi:hypothetical protein